MLHYCLTLAAEPASILYIATGAATFAMARFGKLAKPSTQSSTFMMVSKPASRTMLASLDLL